ncbi:hypothetical protein [Peribacillus glennii]|nr:hypothetical protein [Peribacillus glennii]
MFSIDPATLSEREIYKLLIGSIIQYPFKAEVYEKWKIRHEDSLL